MAEFTCPTCGNEAQFLRTVYWREGNEAGGTDRSSAECFCPRCQRTFQTMGNSPGSALETAVAVAAGGAAVAAAGAAAVVCWPITLPFAIIAGILALNEKK